MSQNLMKPVKNTRYILDIEVEFAFNLMCASDRMKDHVTILPKSRPSPEPHQRKTKERRADISSISSFMIYNSREGKEE